MQLALKACFLGYIRGTCSLSLRLGESPRTLGRECRVHTRVDLPRESLLARQEATPPGLAERRAAGASSVSSPSNAGSATWRAPTTRGSFSARLLFFIPIQPSEPDVSVLIKNSRSLSPKKRKKEKRNKSEFLIYSFFNSTKRTRLCLFSHPSLVTCCLRELEELNKISK